MIPPKITQLPPAPVRADAPVDFSSKADAMIGALQPFADEANILAEFVNTRADNAASSASAVAGVQSAVSADRVLSQQAASNAAGSAAAAAASASTANSRATAAQSSASASEASAVRAENAAGYVENIADGAAPLNNPNFQGVVKVNNVALGYAATAPTVGDGVAVIRQGGYGLGSDAPTNDFKGKGGINQFFCGYNDPEFSGIHAGVTLAYSNDWWSQIVVKPLNVPEIKIRSRHNGNTYSPIFTLYHTGNLLNIGKTQATARTALNLFADASSVMTNGPGQLSNDMSDFLGSSTFDEMAQKVGGGSAPSPTKNHGNVAVTGAQTVTCDVQESDFHIMSLSSSNTTGTLTIDFSNMPDTLGKHFSWHVRLQRGARKTVAFAQTINWAGGVAPTFGSSASSQDLMLFYKVDSETIRGMVIDAW